MPETTGVTFLNKARFPCTLALPIPGSVVTGKDGNAIPGRSLIFTFEKGKFHPAVPVALANMVLTGALGMMPVAVVEGERILQRAFVEGNTSKKTATQTVAEQLDVLKDKQEDLLKLVNALVLSGAISAEVADSIGLSPPAEEEPEDEEEPSGVPVGNPALTFINEEGGVQSSPDGSLLCPLCETWATDPVSPEFTAETAQRSLRMHMGRWCPANERNAGNEVDASAST